MASLLGIGLRTIIRIEKGYAPASINVQRQINALIKLHRPPGIVPNMPTRVINIRTMKRYLGSPGAEWNHWSRQKRRSWQAHRKRFKRILAEAGAGLCVIKFRYKPSLADLGLTPADLPPVGKQLR